ncbi:hypothetical protein V1T76_02785 [Roseibium sp. FZY0029]|uniref:hypothetical protein n=1 Tax=Roseibium sp. FZY0029 TaxID=3116647 RepID=UPI002EB4880A|nr:hypothetical protein [Roseibium sp. FZY0029]
MPLALETGEAVDPKSASDAVPCEEQIQIALINTLNSPEFQSAPQLRAFLGFVVNATLNRQQEKIKGYTIAVEALGRPEDFNPVTDPIVRVEAARLRRRLEKYYAGSGAEDPVRISIPKGSYAPEFLPSHPGALPDCSAALATKDETDIDLDRRHPIQEAIAPQRPATQDVPVTGRGYDIPRSPLPPLLAGPPARNRMPSSGFVSRLQAAVANPVAPRLVFALCLASFLAGYLLAVL